MPQSDALQQPIELDLFEGPFDLLLTLVLRDEVELLDVPLIEVVTSALGENARERWDTDTAGELIVLLAAMAELKARRLLGEPAEEEPDPDTLEAREALAAAPRGLRAVPARRRVARRAPARQRRPPLPPRRPRRRAATAAARARTPRCCARRCCPCWPRPRRPR